MKKLLTIFAVVALISFLTSHVEACVNTFDADGNLCKIGTPELEGTSTQEIGTPMELWAGVGNEGAGTLVGHITFDNENVIINLNDADNDGIPDMFPWVATEVHIHFADQIENFPLTKIGNPIPGHFEYNTEDLENFQKVVVEIDPDQSVIVIPVDFDAVGAIHLAVKPGDVDVLVDYLLNNFNVGDMIQPVNNSCVPLGTCGALAPEEALTLGDIQRAISILTDDDLSNPLPYCIGRVNAILCGVNGIQETAWGDGKHGANFLDANQWATYFNYDADCMPEE